jgi:hypothetical protein
MPRGWFTPQSARRTARRLEPLARGVCIAHRRLCAGAPVPLAEGPVDRDYFDELCRFHSAAVALAAEGVLFRDLARGWFEFPARRAGRDVRLAWRIGSPAPAGWSERGEPDVVRRVDETGPWDDPSSTS